MDPDPAAAGHAREFHRKNMIRLLFRISRNESQYSYLRARIHFEKVTESPFIITHFKKLDIQSRFPFLTKY